MHRPLPPSLTSDFEAQSEPSGSRAFYKMLHLFVACPFFIPLFYFFIVHESVNSIILSFTGSSVHVFIRLFSENPIFKKTATRYLFDIRWLFFIIFHPAAFLLSRCLMSKLYPLCCAPPACMLF